MPERLLPQWTAVTRPYDVVIEGGLVFDGLGNAPVRANVGVRDGAVAAITADPLGPATRTVDASNAWVMPGFVDIHTHYDAEVEVAPELSESLRHGVTTVTLGSCSLSLALGDADELSDMFCRVEALPDALVRPLLRKAKTWEGHRAYFEHLDALPLGPNVTSFVGHSAVRAKVMGIERSLEPGVRPSAAELGAMQAHLREGLDEGYLGLSIQTLPWDKMGGDKSYRSRPLPSTFARWSEYRQLLRDVRARGRVFQGVPNVSTKVNVVLFMLESLGLFRKPLKTTVISMMDLRGQRGIRHVIGMTSRVLNRVLRADFRWQALPEPFDLWADGIDLVVFEEFGAGAAALHLADDAKRRALLRDPKYRAWFRKQWQSKLLPKVFHRNFAWSKILSCPDASLVGRSFDEVGKARGVRADEAFLDLVAEHGQALRWYTVMANDRERQLADIMRHPDVLIGFSDAGAHLRQMAHYNFPLRMLHRVQRALDANTPFMSVERAVHRLTGELATWLGLDAGVLATGKRADIAVVDPAQLDDRLEVAHEATALGYGAYSRLVRRNDDAVRAVLVGGQVAAERGVLAPAVGKQRGFGRVLRAR
jgi:N-acyl-D-aspartate/D-glutamate deacylase